MAWWIQDHRAAVPRGLARPEDRGEEGQSPVGHRWQQSRRQLAGPVRGDQLLGPQDCSAQPRRQPDGGWPCPAAAGPPAPAGRDPRGSTGPPRRDGGAGSQAWCRGKDAPQRAGPVGRTGAVPDPSSGEPSHSPGQNKLLKPAVAAIGEGETPKTTRGIGAREGWNPWRPWAQIKRSGPSSRRSDEIEPSANLVQMRRAMHIAYQPGDVQIAVQNPVQSTGPQASFNVLVVPDPGATDLRRPAR